MCPSDPFEAGKISPGTGKKIEMVADLSNLRRRKVTVDLKQVIAYLCGTLVSALAVGIETKGP